MRSKETSYYSFVAKNCEQQASTQHQQSTNYCAESLLNEQSNPRKSFLLLKCLLRFFVAVQPKSCDTRHSYSLVLSP